MKQLIFLTILASLSSCWPTSISFKDTGSMPESWKTFSVGSLENNAANAPINYPSLLSDELRDGIQNNTHLKLANKDQGEVRIEGVITNYSINPIALQLGDNAAKNRLTINTDFKIIISSPKEEEMTISCARFADYNSSSDISAIESNLLKEINKQIVQDLINKLLSNW